MGKQRLAPCPEKDCGSTDIVAAKTRLLGWRYACNACWHGPSQGDGTRSRAERRWNEEAKAFKEQA